MAIINGTSGPDTLTGTADADTIDGGDGADTIFGGAGDDVILGGTGANVLNGEAGADRFVIVEDRLPTVQSASITGGADRDTVDFGQVSTFPDILTRASYARSVQTVATGSDSFSSTLTTVRTVSLDSNPPQTTLSLLAAGSGVEAFIGSTGNDTFAFNVAGWSQVVSVDGGLGADTITGGTGTDTLNGGAGNDEVYGWTGADSLDGGDGNDFVQGNQGADTISGGEGADTLRGGQDDDRIAGGNGDDLIFGDLGNDSISGGAGQDTVVASAGSDTIDGGTGLDLFVIAAASGTVSRDGPATTVAVPGGTSRLIDVDLIRFDTGYVMGSQLVGTGATTNGSDGADVLRGTANGVVNAGAGDDRIIVTSGQSLNTLILGGAGFDTVDFSEARLTFAMSLLSLERVIVQGGPDDSFVATIESQQFQTGGAQPIQSGPSGFGVLAGGSGVERFVGTLSGDIFDLANRTSAVTIDGGGGSDTIFSGAGSDVLSVRVRSGTVYGGAGNDSITGGAENDFLQGNQGNDTIFAGVGADSVEGGQGDDLIDGGAGADILMGRLGNDTIVAGEGNDTIEGGEGNDRIEGGDGRDLIFGQLGDDRLEGGAEADSLYGQEGNDTLVGGQGLDFLSGGDGNDLILAGDDSASTVTEVFEAGAGDDTLIGGGAPEVLFGRTGNDSILGGAGDDVLVGEQGNDTLSGGAGADALEGGDGTDWMTGGEGADTFAIRPFLVGGVSFGDVVTDFQTGVDKLSVRATPILASASDPAGTYASGLVAAQIAFAGSTNVFAYGTSEGVYVYVNLDATTAPETTFLLQGITLTGLAASDFTGL